MKLHSSNQPGSRSASCHNSQPRAGLPGRCGLGQTALQQGSVLMLTMVTAAIIGITLASYLTMCDTQNQAVARSQTWNSAMPYCEAGIEEALTHLNSVGDGPRETNGWTLVSGHYQMARTLGEGRFVTLISTSAIPLVVSTGYVKAPLSTSEVLRVVRVGTTKQNTGFRGLVAKGDIDLRGNINFDSFNSSDPRYSTAGKYDPTKRRDNGFVGSVEGSITGGGGLINGNAGTGPSGSANGTIGDSNWVATSTGIQAGHYSSDLNLSFPDASVPFSGGFTPSGGSAIITNISTSGTSVTTNVYPSGFAGSIITNPPASYSSSSYPSPAPFGGVSTNTTVTTTTSLPAAGTYLGGIVTNNYVYHGKSVTDYTYDKVTGYAWTTVTYTYSTTITNLTYTTNTYTYVLDSADYKTTSIFISGAEGPSSTMLVRGNARLYVTEDLVLTGNGQILILPGASLELYVGRNADLRGNGVGNSSQNAVAFSVYGLPTCNEVKIHGNGQFTGTIYAPQATLLGLGGGNDIMDIVGAAIVGTAKLTGHFNFHYDELLANQGGSVAWRINAWEEL